MNTNRRISIVGAVGVPANYGGFETLVENLIIYHDAKSLDDPITVYCSSKSYPTRQEHWMSARLKYIPLQANGVQSILYDFLSLFSAVWNRSDVILHLGVSGSSILPLIRLISSARIITNIDGIEWRRDKWRSYAKYFLKFSEKIAVRYSDVVIADNAVIAEYVRDSYGVNSHVIAYGGDHAISVDAIPVDEYEIPDRYAISVCRIEPENNTHMILEAFSRQEDYSLVKVGNWNRSDYGRSFRKEYGGFENMLLLDPIYDLGKLKTLRSKACVYVHGHSAGGTNPSLVEAMSFGLPVLAFDCDFNRSTTENKALYFSNARELQQLLASTTEDSFQEIGENMIEIANRKFRWEKIAEQYFSLFSATQKD